MKKIFAHSLVAFAFLLLPISFVSAASNSGFLNDTIWYSKTNFVEGDTIEIHTAVWNAEQSPLSAKVEFTDGTTILGTRTISVPVHTLQDVFITWKVTAGDHTIKATIKNATITTNGKTTTVTFADPEQSLPKISVAKKSQNGVAAVTKSITDTVDSTLPENVAKPISKGIVSVDGFRITTEAKIETLIEGTNKKLATLNGTTDSTQTAPTDPKKIIDTKPAPAPTKALSGTEKPIAYVELFLLKVASFIFNSAVVFYLVCALLLFIVLRFIYKKIRGR